MLSYCSSLVNNLVLFLLSMRSFSFSPFSLMLAVDLLYIAFIIFRYVSCIPVLSKTFIMKRCCILLKAFHHLVKWSCGIFFLLVYMINYIDRFLYCEPSLHLQVEANMIMVEDFSDMFLDLTCQYIEYVCINVHKWDWSVILTVSIVFVCFSIRVIVASSKEFVKVPSISIVWNNLRSIGVSCSLRIL